MGRRKIEIKAIKDDRNRSVTFLKRKGGLFKKAYELSVLCSVDVAVIIFGSNKKLYEFSSGDIHETLRRYQYCGPAHEHKGPADFAGKRDIDDDEEDEGTTPPVDEHNKPSHAPMMPPQVQNQTPYQHIRTNAPSASPPMPNGPPFQQRTGTPQSQIGSRPSSRNTIRRVSTNFGAQPSAQISQAPPPTNGFVFIPNAPMFSQHIQASMQGPPPSQQQQQQQPQPQYQYQQPPAPQQLAHLQQAYIQDQRRQSMPPSFPQRQPQQRLTRKQSPPRPPSQQQYTDNQPAPSRQSVHSKSLSILTPVDNKNSLLAQHFGYSSGKTDQFRNEPVIKQEPGSRPNSLEVSKTQRKRSPANAPTAAAAAAAATAPPAPQPARTQTHSSRPSLSSVSDIQAPSRTNSFGPKRPRLTVQIPDDENRSETASGGLEASPQHSGENANGTPARNLDTNHPGVVLPPPSPSAASASAILSAGATGPRNPFARPPPPQNTTSQSNNAAYNSANNNSETPISALPTRVMPEGLLPSPSQFFPDWGFGRSGPDSAMLPSPLTFPTPIAGIGPSFLRDDKDDGGLKRKGDDVIGANAVSGGEVKKLKT